jgi:hypothetical protein
MRFFAKFNFKCSPGVADVRVPHSFRCESGLVGFLLNIFFYVEFDEVRCEMHQYLKNFLRFTAVRIFCLTYVEGTLK